MSEFRIVQSRKKNHKIKKLAQQRVNRDSSPAKLNIEKLLQQIKNCEEDLEISEFFQQARELLTESLQSTQIEEIICLGIGRISECSIAKHQIAFISQIAQHFQIPVLKFFDPALSSGEKQLIESLQYNSLSENTEGKYFANKPTLFYLPHCPKQITNNLLFTNWNPEHIQKTFLICNSFSSIIETSPERILRPNAHYILESNSFVKELKIENTFKFTDIFNDFAIHSFPPIYCERIPKNFWLNHPKPNYSDEDLELVTNGSS